MAEFKNDLLKEAIADANKVRETAIANAKLQLEESLTPRIKDEISKILSNEAHDPMKGADAHGYASVGEGVDGELNLSTPKSNQSSGVGSSDNKEPSSAAKNSSDIGKDGGQEIMDGEHEKAQKHASLPGKDEEMKDAPKGGKNVVESADEDDDDDDEREELDEELDLRSIIAQLQAEVDALDGGDDELNLDGDDDGELDLDLDAGPDMDMGMGGPEAPVADPAQDMDMDLGDDGEEELDLEAILGEIEAELREEDDAQLAHENAKLKEENAELTEGIKILHGRLTEVNLLNAKLLFTNKLFRGQQLTMEQKRHVVETFDLATTLREVKLLYATLAEATIPARSKTKTKGNPGRVVTEGIASTVVGGAPSKEVIEESAAAQETDPFRLRMQQLAGIKVLND